MPGNDFFIMMLLWAVSGRGANGEKVSGVLHGSVELRGPYGDQPDVKSVEWTKYTSEASKKFIYLFNKKNNTCTNPCNHIFTNLTNSSLILVHLKKEDEGIYEKTTIFHNSTTHRYNITLSVLDASNISVSFSHGSLTLKCETSWEFKLLQWFKGGHPLPEDQRFNFTENNTTMEVSNLNSSDCDTYTCQVSNENGNATAHVNISDKIPSVCLENTPGFFARHEHVLFPAGFSLIGLLVLGIILFFICKYHDRRKINTASPDEPVYNEPTSVQEEAATPTVDPLVIVYQDFIKPKDSHQFEQSEDFGYSTIADILQPIQLPEETT